MILAIINLLKKLNYKDYSKINEYIYLGNIYSSQNLNFIKENNITVIVNCSKNINFINYKNVFKYRVNLDDDLSYNSICLMCFYMRDLIPIINEHINKKHKILIHCRAGMQRSAAFLAALLMYRYKFSKSEAVKIIKNKRFIAFLPQPNFNLSLDLYEKYIISLGVPCQAVN